MEIEEIFSYQLLKWEAWSQKSFNSFVMKNSSLLNTSYLHFTVKYISSAQCHIIIDYFCKKYLDQENPGEFNSYLINEVFEPAIKEFQNNISSIEKYKNIHSNTNSLITNLYKKDKYFPGTTTNSMPSYKCIIAAKSLYSLLISKAYLVWDFHDIILLDKSGITEQCGKCYNDYYGILKLLIDSLDLLLQYKLP